MCAATKGFVEIVQMLLAYFCLFLCDNYHEDRMWNVVNNKIRISDKISFYFVLCGSLETICRTYVRIENLCRPQLLSVG